MGPTCHACRGKLDSDGERCTPLIRVSYSRASGGEVNLMVCPVHALPAPPPAPVELPEWDADRLLGLR